MGGNRRGVRAASETTIEISFVYQGERCRERIRLQPTPANLRRAEKWRLEVLGAIDRGTFNYAESFPGSRNAARFSPVQGDAISVRDYFTEWLDGRKQTLKTSTYVEWRKTVENIVIANWGDKPLSALSKADIRAVLSGMDVSNKRLANIQTVIRQALKQASDDDVIEVNVLADWAYKRRDAVKIEDDIDPFTPQEQAAILDALTGQDRNLVQFALWTGMRTSELIALRWEDIDWHGQTVHVKRARTQFAVEDEAPKTKAGRRQIRLLQPALDALKAQKAHTYMMDQEVFFNPRTGASWASDNPIRETMFKPALRRAKVRYRRPYQTRHTYASMMLSAGEHPMWVAKQMGHSDWTMIARVYGKWIPAADEQAGSKAVEMFGGECCRNVALINSK